MKKEYVMWLIIAVLVVGLLLGTQKAETMAIDFTAVNNQKINFGAVSAVRGLTNKSVSVWVYQDAYTNGRVVHLSPTDNTVDEFFSMDLNTVENGTVGFTAGWSTSPYVGLWRTATGVVPTGGWYHIVVTYVNSSTANDPIIYVNGVAKATSEEYTPAGTSLTGTNNIMAIGYGGTAASNPIDGRVSDVRVYNRILTADEVLAIYNARGRDNIRNGLVFCPFLKGAAGLQAFDGATLAAGNTIVDPCSGAIGVPAGSPVGVGETYLR